MTPKTEFLKNIIKFPLKKKKRNKEEHFSLKIEELKADKGIIK